MIGAPTLNSRQGDRRQKAMAAALAARARASTLSRTAPTGMGRGARTGVGLRLAGGGGRPSGILSFLSSKGPQGFGPGGVNYAGLAPNPAALVSAVQNPERPLPGGSGLPAAPAGPGPDAPVVPGGGSEQIPISPPTGPTTPGLPPDFSILPGNNLNLIPLGGGVYMDPTTGVLHGAGLGAGPMTSPWEPPTGALLGAL